MKTFYWRAVPAIVAATIASAAAPLGAATPSLSPPIPGRIVIVKQGFDSVPAGYVAEEHFLTGTATSWRAEGAKVIPSGEAPFTTRLIVVRPTDPRKFNGTVLVEWLNVSGGADGSPEWSYMRRELLRDGYAYIGVSAQRVAIDGEGWSLGHMTPLKQADPARYAPLRHPGDQYCYDIFSQAGAVVRGRTRELLGPLRPKRVLAAGESQSAGLLVTYVNAIDPLARVYDGFLIHSRFGWGRNLDPTVRRESSPAHTPTSGGDHIRADVRVPVLTFITETDLMRPGDGYLAARQPDGPKIRTWEVPGTAHADSYTVDGDRDDGHADAVTLASIYAPRTEVFGQKLGTPINAAPQHHYVVEAALVALDRWVATGHAPASKPRMTVGRAVPPQLVLDSAGNATGGIRSPWLDVPLARLSGQATTNDGFGVFFGSTHPFDRTTLARLYPRGRPSYLAKFSRALDAAIARGDVLRADRSEILSTASAMYGD